MKRIRTPLRVFFLNFYGLLFLDPKDVENLHDYFSQGKEKFKDNGIY